MTSTPSLSPPGAGDASDAAVPLAVPDLTGNEERYLRDCVQSNFVSSVGPFVDRFEGLVAGACGAREAVATSAGTTGLHVALLAAGVAPGDLVLLPSLTFIASANAIAHCGAIPWLVDVDPASWTLDVSTFARCLERDTGRRDGKLVHRGSGRRVSAVMPVHTLGTPADMDPIVELAREHGLAVVADAAAALGARYRGREVGQCGAHLSVFSFNGNKTVTCGGGGAVCGDDPALVARVRHLATTARAGAAYDHDEVGFNYRMTNVEAAIGCAQMERLDTLIAAKRRIHADYVEAFAEVQGLQGFPQPGWAQSACWLSAFELCGPWRGRAQVFREALQARGIDSRAFWKPMHMQRPFANAPRTEQTVSESIWADVVLLPCSTGLSAAQQQRVVAAVTVVMASR